jgi:hypothetical protein
MTIPKIVRCQIKKTVIESFDLNPCLFCIQRSHETEKEMIHDLEILELDYLNGYFCVCHACDLRTSNHETVEDAVAQWNRINNPHPCCGDCKHD